MGADKRSLRTPLGRVRHLGAGHGGVGHFIAMRVSSVALAMLTPWFIVAAALSLTQGGGYAAVIDFLTAPVNAVGVILLIAIGFHHMALGMQDVILDYIAKPATKFMLLLLNVLAPLALAAGAVFAVLSVNFGA